MQPTSCEQIVRNSNRLNIEHNRGEKSLRHVAMVAKFLDLDKRKI